MKSSKILPSCMASQSGLSSFEECGAPEASCSLAAQQITEPELLYPMLVKAVMERWMVVRDCSRHKLEKEGLGGCVD